MDIAGEQTSSRPYVRKGDEEEEKKGDDQGLFGSHHHWVRVR